MGGARGVPVASRSNRAMSETEDHQGEHLDAGRRASSRRPARPWRRFEPTILGAGSIALLLIAWELAPHVFTMSAGHQALLHDAEPDRRHALDDVRDRHDLGSARRQRLRLRARARTVDRGGAAARRPARALAHPQCDAGSLRHRVQRYAAAGVPAARAALVRARAVVESGHRVHRRAVSHPDQHLRRRAQRRQDPDQRRALVRRQGMGRRAPGGAAEFAALCGGRTAARRSAAPCSASWWPSSSAPRKGSAC